jgi:shikimate kinase
MRSASEAAIVTALHNAPGALGRESCIGDHMDTRATLPRSETRERSMTLHTESAAERGGDQRVVLTGMMGSGKSSVGRALADRTGWPFIDNDALVERATGRMARELLAEEGAEAMRAAEAAALHLGLELPPPAILAVAAGVVLDAADRERMRRGGFVVWLRAPAETLAARAVGAAQRPWLDTDPGRGFRDAITERDPLFAEIADFEIDTASHSPRAAADLILARLAEGHSYSR